MIKILAYTFLLWFCIVLLSFLLYFVCATLHKRKLKLEYDTEQAFKYAEKHFWSEIKNKNEEKYVEY